MRCLLSLFAFKMSPKSLLPDVSAKFTTSRCFHERRGWINSAYCCPLSYQPEVTLTYYVTKHLVNGPLRNSLFFPPRLCLRKTKLIVFLGTSSLVYIKQAYMCKFCSHVISCLFSFFTKSDVITSACIHFFVKICQFKVLCFHWLTGLPGW